MKKADVKLGCLYEARVSGALTTVRIDRECVSPQGRTQWVGTNVRTGREIRIRSAQRLRKEIMPALREHRAGEV